MKNARDPMAFLDDKPPVVRPPIESVQEMEPLVCALDTEAVLSSSESTSFSRARSRVQVTTASESSMESNPSHTDAMVGVSRRSAFGDFIEEELARFPDSYIPVIQFELYKLIYEEQVKLGIVNDKPSRVAPSRVEEPSEDTFRIKEEPPQRR